MAKISQRTLLLLLCALAVAHAQTPITVKVVVVTMFEIGEDKGDAPGEFQLWVEREHLDRVFPFPAGNRDLRMNGEGVLGVVTGVGTAKAAATIMALGLDPRFDLTGACWIVAGIGGIDPADASIGSAVWAEHVLDGDLAHELDAREMPKDWSTGYVPLRKSKPFEMPRKTMDEGEIYTLDAALVDRAFQLTRGISLADTPKLREARARFTGYPNAQKPPFVLKGDTLSASTFWHGKLMNRWANDWVRYYVGPTGNYVISGMEDTGTLQSLRFLAKAGKVDGARVLVLRTGSNYDMQPPGATAAESLRGMQYGAYSGFLPALEAAFRVGDAMVREILRTWSK